MKGLVNVDVKALENELRQTIKGEVRFSEGDRAVHSTNSSNYRQVPIGGTILRVGKTSDTELAQIIAAEAVAGGDPGLIGSPQRDAAAVNAGGYSGRSEIYKKLLNLRDKYGDLVRQRFPKIPRRVSGYNLDELLPETGFNVARVLVGTRKHLRRHPRSYLGSNPQPARAFPAFVGLPAYLSDRRPHPGNPQIQADRSGGHRYIAPPEPMRSAAIVFSSLRLQRWELLLKPCFPTRGEIDE